ncbi:PEPxxWA-CTERM sorting domain-containing protein [uncultured Phenylobacterium sp.]|uniref:PEPxxWA-CTERM sorting domain-containing protein n=1 Tax=uncultured Phenylobacterium sp. TaxID=349273 RepID=UPI0025E9D9BB|nr:PEPxxWA-CTERM sorting domain-containing protein [uncultured Phenylobacterium sp.]
MASLSAAAPASATIFTLGYADTVIDFFDSGAGPIAGPYGGPTFNSVGFTPVSTSVILGFNDVTFNGFVSLPTGSYITLGFTDEIITNGPGDDIFISEIGRSDEQAEIFVSSDLITFTRLGVANNSSFAAGIQLSFDLGRIGFGPNDVVRAVRVVGLDNNGASPGFDLNAVQASFTSLVPGNPGLPGGSGPVPEPATWAMMITGFGLTGFAMRRRARRAALQVA